MSSLLFPETSLAPNPPAGAAVHRPRRIGRGEAVYPAQFDHLENPPESIWVLGDVELTSHVPLVAIVGTRKCTPYGERVTRELAGALARAGAGIVSGMARGIDSVAHLAALECGAPTIAVLGTGVDVPYPPRNRGLHGRIMERGLVISEYAPGSRPFRWSFPERNRMIAALAKLIIVVEADERSGALNTAGWASGMHRDLAAVPGPIDAPASRGANHLIRDGAHPIVSVDEALQLAGLARGAPLVVQLDDEQQRRVWEALKHPCPSLDVLCSRVGIPARECMEAVTALELRGAVECSLTGEVRRRL